jgi:GNAT superfamily N-acetyltransferase
LSNITFRKSQGTDAQAVFDLTNISVRGTASTHYPAEVIDTWMSGRSVEHYQSDCENAALIIAEVDGIIAGYAHAIPGEIVRLFVDPTQSGIGLGSGLMNRALETAIPTGGGCVKIDATLNAVSFYQKFEFTEVGRSVFPGRDNDLPPIEVVVMERHFSAPNQ